jgi:hypothetical protein
MELMWPVLGRARTIEVIDATMNLERLANASEIARMIAT